MTIGATPDETYAILADVPDSVAHFPRVASLVPENGGYTWTLETLGVGKFTIRTSYGCKYHVEAKTHSVSWEPIAGVGNTRVSGHWTIQPSGSATHLSIDNTAELTLDIPRLFSGMAHKIVQRENNQRLEEYLQNLRRTLEGGNGRVR